MEFTPITYRSRGSMGYAYSSYSYLYGFYGNDADCECDVICHTPRCRMPGFASYDESDELLEVDWGPDSSGLYWQNEVRPLHLHPVPCSYTVDIEGIANYGIEDSWCDECENLNLSIKTQAHMHDNPYYYAYYGWGNSSAYTDFEYADRRQIYDDTYFYSTYYLYGWYIWDGYDTKGFKNLFEAPLCTENTWQSACNFYYLTVDIGVGLDADHLIDDSVCPSGYYEDYIYRNEFREQEGRPQLYVQAITTFRAKQLRSTEEVASVQCAPYVVYPQFACSFCRSLTPTWLYTPVMFRTVLGEYNGDYIVTNSGINQTYQYYLSGPDAFVSGIIPAQFTEKCTIKPYHGDLDGRDLTFTVTGDDLVSPAVFKIPNSVPEESGIYTACDFSSMSITISPRRQDEDKWGAAQYYQGLNHKFAEASLVSDDIWVDRSPTVGLTSTSHWVSGIAIKGLGRYPLHGSCTVSYPGPWAGFYTIFPCYDYGAAMTPEMGHGLLPRSMWVSIEGVVSHLENKTFETLEYGDCFESELVNGKYNLNATYYRKEPWYSGSPLLPQFSCGSIVTDPGGCYRDPTVVYDFVLPTGICDDCIDGSPIKAIRAKLVAQSGTTVDDWNVSLYIEVPSHYYYSAEDDVGNKIPGGYWGVTDNAEPYALFVHHFNNAGEAIPFNSISRMGFTQIPASSAPWLDTSADIWNPTPYYPAPTGVHDFSNTVVEAEFYRIENIDCVDKARKCWLCYDHNGPEYVDADFSNVSWERTSECPSQHPNPCHFISCSSPWLNFDDCIADFERLCVDPVDGWPSGWNPGYYVGPCSCVRTSITCAEPYEDVDTYCECYSSYYHPCYPRPACTDPLTVYTVTPEEYFADDLLNGNYILERQNYLYDQTVCSNLWGDIWYKEGYDVGALNVDSACTWEYQDICWGTPGWQQPYDPECSGHYKSRNIYLYYYINARFQREVKLTNECGTFYFQEVRSSGDWNTDSWFPRYNPPYSGGAVPTAPPYWDCDEEVTLTIVHSLLSTYGGEFTVASGSTITVRPYTGV